MRILYFFLAVMFLIFAFLQINDPDPVVWILIYGGMAVLSIMGIFEFYPRKFIIGLLVLFAVYSILLVPGAMEWFKSDDKGMLFDDLAKMRYPYIEETREFLGLCICIGVLLYLFFRSRRR